MVINIDVLPFKFIINGNKWKCDNGNKYNNNKWQ